MNDDLTIVSKSELVEPVSLMHMSEKFEQQTPKNQSFNFTSVAYLEI